MGLRKLLGFSLVILFLSYVGAYRERRQANADTTFYQPPILLNAAAAHPPPSTLQYNSYQPPIPQSRQQPANSIEYRSPLEYSSSSSQQGGYNQQPQSVHYIPPAQDSSQSFSVQQQPSGGASAERTYSTHSKVVGSSASAQAIHKAPASEIEAKKESLAKEKDAAKDEYVVYYYYYYDNDTSANNNLSLNFDDIPSLESYDDGREPEKIPTGLNAQNGNALEDQRNASSQARSASSANDAFIRADKQPLVQPLKPVSNVFRYGSNEVPRFPVLPNFVVSEVPTTTEASPTPQSLTSDSSTMPPSSQFSNIRPSNDEVEDDTLNNVLDSTPDLKEVKAAEEETTTTTTTEPPTTTEIVTTTTERSSRRRPSIGGGGSRRRFNPSPSSSFSSNRSRSPSPSRGTTSSSSSSTTTTTTSVTPTRRSFQGSNRLRSRPSIGGTSRSRTTENGNEDSRPPSRSTTEQQSTTSASTTSRSRFTSSAPRRFQSSRSRSQASSTTSTSTTRSPTQPGSVRSRPTSRPRPNLISRNRPPRPGFLRPRAEETETTTTTPEVIEETSPSGAANEVISSLSTAEEGEDSEESEETSEEEEESEEPTTTESNRFSALFRPRNRNALGGNRPRPVIGNRPSRS